MITVDLAVPRRALAIGAHPDDVEFGCGATVAKWADTGAHVELCVCTDGAKGTWDMAADLRALIAAREDEQRAAALVLGARDVHFLRQVDGELTADMRTRDALCALIRRVRPDVVLAHDPWRRYRLHPDHQAAGRLAIDAIVTARDPHFFPEQGLAPHRPATLLLFEAERPDHVERVDGYVERKVTALLEHRSQWLSTMGIDVRGARTDAQRAAFERRVRDDVGDNGLRAGLRAAEAFRRVDDL